MRFDGETEVLTGDFGDDGEAAVWVISFGLDDGWGGEHTSKSRRDRFAP